MKKTDISQLDSLPGKRIKPGETFKFQCHEQLACYNQCCRNLNLFLYPYDILRLKKQLKISSDQFLGTYVDVVLRKDNYLPDVLLKMADNQEKTCPFLSADGCLVYPDRPDTCRTFPIEQGAFFDAAKNKTSLIHFFRPPDFCQGQYQKKRWSTESWAMDQNAVLYNQMTARWAEVKRLFESNPWGNDGPYGSKGKMVFMAAYNIDEFREFVLHSTFLTRFKIKTGLIKKIKTSDIELLKLGFEWIKLMVWGKKSRIIQL